MPLDAFFLEVVWRVPNAPLFVVGFLIVGWGLATGVLAFTGSQKSGLPEIHFPRPSEPGTSPASSGEAEA